MFLPLSFLLQLFFEHKIISKAEQNYSLPEVVGLLPMPNYAPHFLELVHGEKLLNARAFKSNLDKSKLLYNYY